MTVLFERMAILGLGLLGGSIAMAARKQGLVREIVAWGRREHALENAVQAGIVDSYSLNASQAVAGADFVVLAVPVDRMAPLLREVSGALAAGALVTDVGSVKGELARTLPPLLAEGVRYVGSHPMTGSHLRGVEHARADLLEGAACVVTSSPEDLEVAQKLMVFWQKLGGRGVQRDAQVHDEQVAWVSHLPHLLAFAFAGAFEEAPQSSQDLIGSGFLDFTRIGRSDAAMWSAILCANREALQRPLARLRRVLDEFADELSRGEVEALESHIAKAQGAFAKVDSTNNCFAGEATTDLGA